MTIQEMKQKKKEKGYTYAQIEDAGVREYWLVDPNQKAVLVYFLKTKPARLFIRLMRTYRFIFLTGNWF